VADLDVGAAVAQVAQSFGGGGEEAGAFEYNVGAAFERCVPVDLLGALFDAGDFLDVDGDVGAELFCEFKASGGAADDDDVGGAHLFGAEEGNEADGAAALDDDGIAELHFAAHGGVDADGVGLGEHGDFG